jgi:hypothetical protein
MSMSGRQNCDVLFVISILCFEADLIDLVHSIGHGPQLLKVTKSKQNEWMPYPGGQINYKVMTRVPGADVDKIRDNLSARERQSIRSQLAKILEAMADKNRVLRTVDLSFLRYDRAKHKLWAPFFPNYIISHTK